jgi:hypothetical protein
MSAKNWYTQVKKVLLNKGNILQIGLSWLIYLLEVIKTYKNKKLCYFTSPSIVNTDRSGKKAKRSGKNLPLLVNEGWSRTDIPALWPGAASTVVISAQKQN